MFRISQAPGLFFWVAPGLHPCPVSVRTVLANGLLPAHVPAPGGGRGGGQVSTCCLACDNPSLSWAMLRP
jgi:hypothetical protein